MIFFCSLSFILGYKSKTSDLLNYWKRKTNPSDPITGSPEETLTMSEVNRVSKELKNGDGGFGSRTSYGITSVGYVLLPTGLNVGEEHKIGQSTKPKKTKH